MININTIYERLLNTANCIISNNEKQYMIDTVNRILNQGYINTCDLNDVQAIIKISNLIYNNAPNVLLPLDDSLYDRLLVLCRKQGVSYPVGAPSIKFINLDTADKLETHDEQPIDVVSVVENRDKMIYYDKFISNSTDRVPEDYIIHHDETLVDKKSRNVSHDYNMCGTLEKCKFVLNQDAKDQGMYDDPSVLIFERDFLGKHIQERIIDQNNISLLVSLKYDGISVEETVCGDTIESACTRGDMSSNEASDLTPILNGCVFPRATNQVSNQERFGIKFEYIITQENQAKIYNTFGKRYVNARNAVIGLLGGLDARKYRDYLTPVPLESSLDIDRISEVQFLNKYYTKGIDFRYIIAQGNYMQVLYMVKKFVEEADEMRNFLNFQYDGVVVEYIDQNLRNSLGKRNSIPRYAIAIKFNPMRRQSIFTHYTYSVGQDGTITPMAHFKPVEFFGAIHDKTTVHSLARFKKLNLSIGDKVNLTLNNDVIVYLTKPEEQEPNTNKPEIFPTTCPSCGRQLIFTDSSAICTNFFCPERCIARVSNMLKKLNIKDFSTETIRTIEAKSLTDLLHYQRDYLVSRLGDVLADKFLERMNTLRNCNYNDYRLIGSLGFTSIAVETWRLILEHMSLQQIITCTDSDIDELSNIKGIGYKTIETIKRERPMFIQDIQTILNEIKYIPSTNMNNGDRIKVRFSGVRDHVLEELYKQKGFDCGEGSVTKDTAILIIPYLGYNSNNTTKAFKYLTQKYNSKNDTIIDIGYDNLKLCEGMSPFILTLDQAYQYINNYTP